MSSDMLVIIWQSLLETLAMVAISGGVGALLGVPLGVVLFITDRKSFVPMPAFNAVLGTVINALRSVPFIILLVAIIPFTRLVVGTSIGTAAAVVPLTLAVAPFIARIVETSLREVDKGLIEAAQSMGASNWQIVTRVIIRETKPSLIVGAAITLTTIIGYTTMGTVIASGGIGALGITYGHYRFNRFILTLAVVVLVIMVQLFQSIGMKLAKKFDKRYR